jgi:tRNA(Ile)-lysidine synthase
MNLVDQFVQNWKQRFPGVAMNNCRLVLAVSGGVDSVVLADLLQRTGVDFIIAHCNFQLRGEESERDETFVRSLGEKYSKEVLVQRFDTKVYAQEEKLSIQEAARVLRYDWFRELSQKSKIKSQKSELPTPNSQLPTFIATAHHANDNIETVLMHFFRGTGISGLHGILPLQANIMRPLLFARREEIAAYAAAEQLTWVEDSSNASEKYTRNFFRLQLLPAVKTVFPQVEENLLHNIDRFTETELLYKQAVDMQLKKLLEQKGNEVHIPILKLLKTLAAHTLLWEILQPYAFSAAQTAEVMKLVQHGENSSYVASASHRAIKNRNWLIIAPLPTEAAQHIVIEATDHTIIFRDGVLQIKVEPISDIRHPTSDIRDQRSEIALLDADKVKFPLLLRPWKQGDYFYPLGMDKKKKLSKFLIGQKLSATRKEKIWVLEMDQKIVWVTGIRIDNRFKITANTRTLLQISVEPA